MLLKNKLFLVSLIALSLSFTGCQLDGCFKVGGEYQGKKGEVQYCFNPEKSKQEKTVVLQNGAEVLFSLTEKEIEKLNELIPEIESKDAKVSSVMTPLQRLKAKMIQGK